MGNYFYINIFKILTPSLFNSEYFSSVKSQFFPRLMSLIVNTQDYPLGKQYLKKSNI